MNILRFLLLAIPALLWWFVSRVRNGLYTYKIFTSEKVPVRVISIGNLAVGGSGKTPMAEFVLQKLKEKYSFVFLSRGYKRKTKGYRCATPNDTPDTLGDEPYQVYKKFQHTIPVLVDEKRAHAVQQYSKQKTLPDAVLLDDGFQHRALHQDIKILLSDYQKPFYDDAVLPLGRLRETRAEAKRADVVILTKCPNELTEANQQTITQKIKRYTNAPVFFTHIAYGNIQSFGDGSLTQKNIVAVSGLANAYSFHQFLQTQFSVVRIFDFPDHHAYSFSDIEKIEATAEKHQAAIITTEKDFVKLNQAKNLNAARWFYLPIRVVFLHDEKKFLDILEHALTSSLSALRKD